MTSQYANRTVLAKKIDHRETAHHDAQGRLIGALCQIETIRWDAAPADQRWGYSDKEIGAVEYTYTPHATRDKARYGASQSAVGFATEAARDAAVEKYFAGFAKRMAKKFPNGEG